MFIRKLLSSTALRAPEDDQGFDLNEDLHDGEGRESDDEVEEDADAAGAEDEFDAAGGEEDDDAENDEGQRRQVRQPSRGERRFQALSRDAKEAKERAERAERAIEELRQGRHQQDQRESAAERQERLTLMTPEERTDYLLREQEQRFSNENARIRFEMADRDDRADFRALCAADPVLAKLKDKVEETLAAERRAGRPGASREVIATYLLGQMARERATRASGKQRKAAEQTKERQTSRPGAGRSDAGRGDRAPANEREARRKRLENVSI